MSVYVDDCETPFGRMKMAHLTADTLEELHEMAGAIGLKASWFQDGSTPHYDVSQSKRIEAIKLGAVAETWRESARRRMRAKGYEADS